MIRLEYATPTTPMPLLPTAASVPATCVPCPKSSLGRLSSPTKSQPWTSSTYPSSSSSIPLPAISPGFVHRLPARSPWFSCMPESMTATTTPGSPVVVFHAALASMSASPGWSKPHWSGRPGSLGVSEAVMTWSGSAYSTPGCCSSRCTASATGRSVSTSSSPGTRPKWSLVRPTMAARARALAATVAPGRNRTMRRPAAGGRGGSARADPVPSATVPGRQPAAASRPAGGQCRVPSPARASRGQGRLRPPPPARAVLPPDPPEAAAARPRRATIPPTAFAPVA